MTTRWMHRAACCLVFLILTTGCVRCDRDDAWEEMRQGYETKAVRLLDKMDSPDDEWNHAAFELKFQLTLYAMDEIVRRAIMAESFEARIRMHDLLEHMVLNQEASMRINGVLWKVLCRPLTDGQKNSALNVCSIFAQWSQTAVRFMVSTLRDENPTLRYHAASALLSKMHGPYGEMAAEEVAPLLLGKDKKGVKTVAHLMSYHRHPYIAELLEEAAAKMDDPQLASYARHAASKVRMSLPDRQRWHGLPDWAYEPLPPWTGPPDAFSLTAPENGAKGVPLNPLLDWEDAEGATEYHVMVSSESDLVDCVLELVDFVANVDELRESHYRIPPGILQPGIRYYWRVWARSGRGSTFSVNGPYSFQTASDATVIEPVLPNKVVEPLGDRRD